MNKTKIVATIGPASNSREMLRELILAGVNVARLNFSHGSHEQHMEVITAIRELSKELEKPVGILLDLQGPKIRTGELEGHEPVMLESGKNVKITAQKIPGNASVISTTYTNLPSDVEVGDKILLDDGLIELKVIEAEDDTVECMIINGGLLKEKKGINLPGVNVTAPSLTDKDMEDLLFGIDAGVDFFALSFVRNAEDIVKIKNIIASKGVHTPVIAKIEKPEAVANLNEILEISDGVMVARGDLGVELNPEQVPTVQKTIIKRAREMNKVVITATQMLETMSVNPIPTRAEASDVANAIFDGTDAIMLSGETASGNHPLRVVKMMRKIADEAEQSPYMDYNIQYERDTHDLIAHAISQAAVNMLHEIDGHALLNFTSTGSTAKLISKQRPSKPIFVFTSNPTAYNQLTLVCNVFPFMIKPSDKTIKLIEESQTILSGKGLVSNDNMLVVVAGAGLISGSTDFVKLHKVSI